MSTGLYESIRLHLAALSVPYQETRHSPVFTSLAASRVSEHREEEGTKSLALRGRKCARLVVITVPGAARVDFAMLSRLTGIDRLTMCSAVDLLERLGTEQGGVAPFGYGREIGLLVSTALYEEKSVYLNAGRNDITIRLAGSDFKKVMRAFGAAEFDMRSRPDPSERRSGS